MLGHLTHPEPALPMELGGYDVLRRGGAGPASARAQLKLGERNARRLERLFQARAARGDGEGPRPKFARHAAHVAAVLQEGGFPALTERRRGRNGAFVSLPLTWPARQG